MGLDLAAVLWILRALTLILQVVDQPPLPQHPRQLQPLPPLPQHPKQPLHRAAMKTQEDLFPAETMAPSAIWSSGSKIFSTICSIRFSFRFLCSASPFQEFSIWSRAETKV